MDWIAKLEECSIDLLYVAADCGDAAVATQLKTIAAVLELMAREARAKLG